ncbi:hypothetical protein EDD90_2124 [Streptomyces sp. Ag109_O5-1]|uniref:hypothetical protein n=1 Tax=Streptomyces sp. Ag109_O5-1 TaxID=1938851 RepID=UPI000F4E2D8E|nr:hypothetical protein [Streptomyces sp. Ag109_O5-1]RPE39155.1 hypothetical protein EDD90_2124 [Streptomyces sp. Ag109_O5-1]
MRTPRFAPAAQQTSRRVASLTHGAAIAVGLLLTTGCSASLANGAADVAPTPPVIAATPTAPSSGYDGLMRLPLSAYGTSEQDDDLLFRTRKALVVRCMKKRGHSSYSGQNMTRTTAKTEEDKEAVRPAGAWGYLGRATAKRLGFHIGVQPPTDASRLTGQAAKDSQACLDEVTAQLPDLTGTRGWKLTQDLFGQSLQQAGADRRVSDARTHWSACMSSAGHPADDPQKLADSPWNTAKPTAQEIAAATAAESCTRSSGLAAVYFAVLTGYQQQLISTNATILTDYQEQVQKQTGQVAHLLAAPPAA